NRLTIKTAERMNRTLIEAARTMLADSLLPTTFWAEAVSTACYIFNRVRVTKPQNKTPYELLFGHKPSISYIRPFRCHVTILDTLSVLGKDLTVEDYAKRMVELVNQRRKHFTEERARAKRNKPMTQTQLKNYMSNFLKNQGTWKLTQLKKLNFEEESLKRFGEELRTKTTKNLKFDDEGTQPTEEKIEEDKDDKPIKKTGKRRKHIARKGFHTDHDRDESDDSDEVNEKDDSTSGRKGVYPIVRENGTDMVYISFGAMLTDISRDDLTELYRIVMKKHGMNEPEDEFEKVLWEYLKNMFEEPLSTDSIWSLPGQQRIICWRYYDACRVHCLNLESADVYMLIERKYPLSAEVCKAMLDKKLQGGKPDEDCYKLLKMMEKQAGAKGLTSPEKTAIVEMVFSQPWTCTFLVAKGLATPELMANWKIIMLQFKNNSKDNAHKILKKLIMKTLKET
ncbi:retrovirus-related pol polyprotein from transposon TNT 1-94, partial [Tanacetum coccineum]